MAGNCLILLDLHRATRTPASTGSRVGGGPTRVRAGLRPGVEAVREDGPCIGPLSHALLLVTTLQWCTMNYRERIVRDARVVGGEPVLKGTRVTLRTVLASLAEGASTEEILADFPTLSREDVRAVVAFAAASAQEDLPLAEVHVKR